MAGRHPSCRLGGRLADIPDYRLELTVVRATVNGVPGNLFLNLAAYPA